MKGIWEKEEKKYERVGKSPQVSARLNTMSCYFPRAKIILGVLEMPCAPQKPKLAAAKTTQLAQKLEIVFKKINSRMIPIETSLEGNERNMEQKREK